MGKKWFKKKKKQSADSSDIFNSNKRGFVKPKKERPQKQCYEEIVRECKEFEIYYKTQKIVDESEWDAFMTCLKQDLPAAFRFTGSTNNAHALSKLLKEKFVSSCYSEAEKQLQFVCLPWYPDQLGWQLNLTRKDIRRSEAFWKLHQFLITETETGNISRQEAVSMIPPLLLEVNSDHKVLDMCAAPGSKTAQIIEFLHNGTSVPKGIVIANDVDNKRCYMLTHQAKRLQSPTLVITNHDAAFMPTIHSTRKDGSVGPLKFDRILCDVPCSGDGTLRKNFDVWGKWNSVNGANLHGLQLRIARRGFELLSVGGRLVYSTCSMNPLENEAVVNRLLTEYESSIVLLNVHEKLLGLKFVPGLEHWTIMNRELLVIKTPDEIPSKDTNYLHKHLFPPDEENKPKRNLKRCIRILPHHQDTGGFFVAVFKKLRPLPGEKIYEESDLSHNQDSQALKDQNSNPSKEDSQSSSKSELVPASLQTQRSKLPSRKRRCRGFKEEPFFYLNADSDLWKSVSSFFGLPSHLDASHFLTRTQTGNSKNLYFSNALVKDVVTCNEDRIKIINTGVKVMVRCDNQGSTCKYRLSQEGANVLLGFLSKRKLKIKKEDMITILRTEDLDPPPPIEKMHEDTQALCHEFECGSIAMMYEESSSSDEAQPLQIDLVGWKGKFSLRCYVAKTERIHFLRLLGCDTSIYEKNKFAELKETKDEGETEPVSPLGEIEAKKTLGETEPVSPLGEIETKGTLGETEPVSPLGEIEAKGTFGETEPLSTVGEKELVPVVELPAMEMGS